MIVMTEHLDHIPNGGETTGETTCDVEIEPTSKSLFIKLKEDEENWDDIEPDDDKPVENIEKVEITREITFKAFKKLLFCAFKLDEDNLVLKLRNHRGSIIPLSFSIQENCESRPYTLEVCKVYENITPLQRTASLPTYEEVLKRKLQSLDNRVVKLADHAPCLPQRQQEKVYGAISDLNDRMSLLERKITDADDTQWQGMFKRNPLW